MRPEEEEKAWLDFLAQRKKTPAPDPDFTRRVMAAVRARESQGIAHRTPRTPLPDRIADVLRSFWNRPRLAMALATALMLAAVSVYVTDQRISAPSILDVTRIKGGGFGLGFLLKRGKTIAPAVPGALYLPGDRLQAVYSSPSEGYLHMFSLDDSGNVICFSCQAGNLRLPPGQEKTLDFALELDGSHQSEAMVGFWTRESVPSGSFEARLRLAWKRAGHDYSALRSILIKGMPEETKVVIFPIKKRGRI